MKKYGLILSFVGLWLFITPLIKADTVQAPATANQPQQQLDAESLRLIAIDTKLARDHVHESKLINYQDEVEKIMADAAQLQQAAQKNAEQQSILITALGTPPAADAPPEDPTTAGKRKQLETTQAIYNGQIKQANAILTHARSVLKTITHQRLHNKAKNLMQRSLPLYHPSIWQKSPDNTYKVEQQTWQNTKDLLARSKQVLQTPSVAVFSLLTLWIITVVGSFISWSIYRRYGRRFTTAHPSLFRKIITTVANTLAKGVIPILSCIGFLYALLHLGVLNDIQCQTLKNLTITLGGIGIAYGLIQSILAPEMSNWRLLQVKNHSAQLLSKQLLWFTILASLNWFISTIDDRLPLTLILPSEFIFRMGACIIGLVLLQKQYWRARASNITLAEDTPGTTRSAHFIFINYLRIAAILVFLTNPIFMLFGYIELANALFISFLETVVIVAVLLGIHIVVYEVLGNYLGVGNTNMLDKTLNLSDRSKKMLHYWLVVMIDAVFFIAGTVAIIIAWGVAKSDIWRFVKPLFLGFTIGQYQFSLSILFFAITAFAGLFTITRLLQRFLERRVFPYTNLDSGAQHAMQQGIGYLGITLAIVAAIGLLGINLTSLALIAGALSVGIGFGLQHIVSNFIAGIILLVERPIKIGDRIIVGTDEGTVKRISVRATEVEAVDGSSVLIPNSQLITERVRNWTFRNPLTRVIIPLGVAYGSDTHKVEQILLEIAKKHPDIAQDPAPNVAFINFGASSLDFKLTVAVYDISKRGSVGSELHYSIEQAFREHDIDMPFPQCEVTLKQSPPV